MLDLARAVSVATDAAREAGAFIRQHVGPGLQVRAKGLNDFVTEVDEAAEHIILGHLRTAFPDDAVLAEESAEAAPPRRPDGRRWIVDPLDGTTNFAHGVPPFAVSIALEDPDGPAAAVVYEITRDELFTATRGGGLKRDGEPAGVSDTDSLKDTLIATGFPFRDFAFEAGYIDTFRALVRATRGLRRHGAASVDLAWVACGRFDGFFEAGLAPWDLAAGVLLVTEGGGRVSTLLGEPLDVFGGSLAATNGRVHDALLAHTAPLGRAWATR